MPKSQKIPFFHEKEESEPLNLTEQEQYDMDADWEDIKNQREFRDSKLEKWRWAGSVYNIVQTAQADDRISQITLGWIRSYIDTGIAQMTAGQPEFDYDALGRGDHARTIHWKQLVKTIMARSNFGSHQKIAMTDAHVFGPGILEVYQQRPYRTIRVPRGDKFEEKVIVDHRVPKVGVRAISPFRCTRNPNVSDPNEVGSCTKEENLTWNQFVAKYGRCFDENGKNKYKNIEMIVKGSHVKITIYQDEIRDVYRVYACSYGNKSDGESQTPPEQLGIPIFDRPLKIHDVYNRKDELVRSLGLNIPGMCNLVFLPYFDRMTDDFEEHCIYGMGLPEHMEGLDTFMQTAFNMTVDNWRLANTIVLNYESKDGTMPDFDANAYYGGEYVDAKVTPQPLGKDMTVNFDNIYEVMQKLSIPATGININQIAGDTSRTAFEFAQRIEANNKRNEMRLKEWEDGPLKRLGTLLLSAGISELTVHDLENIEERDAKSILAEIDRGKATREDFEFEKGKPVRRKVRYYIDMKGYRENFTKKRNTRKLDYDSADNTLVADKKNPDAIHKVPVTEEYVYPSWYAESGILFDTKVDSSRMIVNKKIKDYQALQALLQNFMLLLQVDPTLVQKIDVMKFFESIMKFADIDLVEIVKKEDDKGTAETMKKIEEIKNAILSPPLDVPIQANALQSGSLGGGQGGNAAAQQAPTAGVI